MRIKNYRISDLYRIFYLIAICGCLKGCTTVQPPEKLVVLTFDDAVRSHLDYVAPILKEKGFGATFFVSNAWMNDSVNFMQWNEVGELYRMEFEIGNHSWTHEPLHTANALANMERNLSMVDSALLANGVPKPLSFGYPGNHFAPGTIDLVSKLGYKYARRGMQPEIPYGKIARGPLYDPAINHPLVIPTTADAYPQWTLDYFKSIIDRGVPGKAIILQFHGVPDVAHPWVHTDPVLFRQFMDYLEEIGAKVIALKDLDRYLSIRDVEDPALHYTNGVPGQINPCPEEADVWILAGQSNMQGSGRTPDTLSNPHIWMMNMDDKWSIARSPVHRIFEARAPAYPIAFHELSADPEKSMEKTLALFREKGEESKYEPIGGTGPGLFFARHLQENTKKSVGLIPCALGGSTIKQWSPQGKVLGDSSLYGAMLNRARSAGLEHIKGMIWYQGESEGIIGEPDTYEEKLLQFIDAVREDLKQPDLPIIIIQIGRLNSRNPKMGKDWEAIRNIQQKVVKARPSLYITSAIDLELDDVAHLSTESNKRLGARIGEIVLGQVYDLEGHAGQPQLYSIKLDKDPSSGSHYLKLHYREVNGSLKGDGKLSGFELRIGNETRIPYVISRIEKDPLDPAGLKLFLSAIPDKPAELYYGPGLNPNLNITDSLDMPLLAFGPLDIDFESLKNTALILEQ